MTKTTRVGRGESANREAGEKRTKKRRQESQRAGFKRGGREGRLEHDVMETGARGERGRVTYTRRGRSDRSQAGVEIADHKVSLGARSAKLGIYKRAVCVVLSRLQNRKTRHVVDANVICRSRSKRHACEQKKREWRERDEEEKERHARKERSSCYCYRTGDNCAEGTKKRERERERDERSKDTVEF